MAMTLAILGLLLAATPARAQLEVVGGPTYNTYSLDWGSADSRESDLPFNSGWGFYGGVQYWMHPSLAIGAQVDTFTGAGRERWALGDGVAEIAVEVSGQGTGYLATLAAPIAVPGSLDVTPFVALGTYSVRADVTVSGKTGTGAVGDVTARAALTSASRLGGKFGVTAGTEVVPGLTLSGQLAYRLVPAFDDLRTEVFGIEQEWMADRGINVSGLSAGVALTYRF